MTPKAHAHEYVPDTRPGWAGVVCRVCGLHVPASMVHLPTVQGRLVRPEKEN